MRSEISILHTIADIRPQSGGTSRVVVDLADALANQSSIKPYLVTQALLATPTLPSVSPRVQRIISLAQSPISLGFGLPLRRALRSLPKRPEASLIHNHGLWLAVNHWASRFSRKHGIPMIIQPHGMLEPWALNHRALKKRIAMALFQRGDLHAAKALIATSHEEYSNIRKLGFRQPIALIANGVKIDFADNAVIRSLPRNGNTRTALFMSRIHPIKGLENLVRAWAQVAPPEWCLRIAGPDEEGHLQKIMRLVSELGIDKSFEYVGAIDTEAKSIIYRDADLFVLPTYGENFGVVVAEALAHGLPVITTRGAPWADLETFDCGWWIDIGVEPLVQALRAAMSLGDDELRAMGARGREYVRRYDWDEIARQTEDVYRWVLGLGSKPDCVHTD